jgi:hypothetical protein
MSDLDPTARDELVSAFLDGEATPAERAQIEGDPELLERATELRSVVDLVAAPVLVDRALRSGQIEAALAQSSTAPNITSLETRRTRRLDPRVLSAAAVVLAAIVALPFVFKSGSDDTTAALNALDGAAAEVAADDGTTSSAMSGQEAGDDTVSRDLDDTTAMAAPLAPILEVGEVADLEALALVVSQELVGETENAGGADGTVSLYDPEPETAGGNASIADCPGITDEGAVTVEGQAIVDGELRWFAVLDSRELILIDGEICEIVGRLPLP